MSAWQMLMAADWLWPFVLLGMALVGLLTASLVWASGSAAVQAESAARPAPRGAWLFMLAVPLLVMALYAALGHPRAINPRERQPVPDEAAETMVDKLAERLQGQPGNLQGWLMLARSYKVLGRYAESAEAWERARDLAWNDVDSLAEWAEARILSQGQHFDRRSQELLARAMSLNPDHPGVLLLRGLAALDRGDTGAARKAFTTLRNQYPDASPDRNALDAALAQMDAGQDPRQRRGAPAGQAGGPRAQARPEAPEVPPGLVDTAQGAPEKRASE